MTRQVLVFDQDAVWLANQLAEVPGYRFHATTSEVEALAVARNCQILLALAPRISPALLEAMPGLQWVQALTTGTDNLMGLPPRIAISSARGIHGPQMSELAILLMLAAARRFPGMLQNQRDRVWDRWPQPLLQGKTVCLVGLGVIAEAVATRAAAFGMQVTGVSDGRAAVPGFARIYPRAALTAATAEADFLVIIVPYAPDTHHLIGAAVLAVMKPSAILINISRGGCVDEAALLECLNRGGIAGAALDVFATEPLPQDSQFWQHPAVIITPHIGGMSDSYAAQTLPLVARNLAAFAARGAEALENRVIPQTKGAA